MCATDDARPVKDCLDEAAPHSLVDPPGLDVGDDERPQRARRRLDHGGARREVLEGGMEADLSRAGIEMCADQSSQAVNKLRALLR